MPLSPPPRKALQSIRRLLKLLPSSRNAPNEQLFSSLNTLRTSPSTISSDEAATIVAAISNPLLSFDFYRFLRSSTPAFDPKPCLFSSLLESQLRSVSPHRFRIRYYLAEMKRFKLRFSPAQFRCLVAAAVQRNLVLSRDLIDDFVDIFGPDSGIYGAVMFVLVENGMIEEAVRVAERGRTEIESQELEFYQGLMALYRATGDAKKAMEVFLEMGEKKATRNEETYRILLGILCRVGWVKLCWVVLEDMTKNSGFRLDKDLSLDLMRSFLNHGMVSEAEFLVKKRILEEGESFSLFAERMAVMRKPLEAFELLKSTVEPASYAHSLIRGCSKARLIQEAEKIFQELKSMEHSKSVLAAMVCLYSRAGLRASAERFWKEMEEASRGGFDAEACLCMMSMYGEIGQVGEVAKLFDKMAHSGSSLNAEAYAALMHALAKAGRINEAERHLYKMMSSELAPTPSMFAVLIEGYLKAGAVSRAMELFEKFEDMGMVMEETGFACIVAEVIIRTGRYTKLHQYLDGLARSGIQFGRERGRALMRLCRDDDLCSRRIGSLME